MDCMPIRSTPLRPRHPEKMPAWCGRDTASIVQRSFQGTTKCPQQAPVAPKHLTACANQPLMPVYLAQSITAAYAPATTQELTQVSRVSTRPKKQPPQKNTKNNTPTHTSNDSERHRATQSDTERHRATQEDAATRQAPHTTSTRVGTDDVCGAGRQAGRQATANRE